MSPFIDHELWSSTTFPLNLPPSIDYNVSTSNASIQGLGSPTMAALIELIDSTPQQTPGYSDAGIWTYDKAALEAAFPQLEQRYRVRILLCLDLT